MPRKRQAYTPRQGCRSSPRLCRGAFVYCNIRAPMELVWKNVTVFMKSCTYRRRVAHLIARPRNGLVEPAAANSGPCLETRSDTVMLEEFVHSSRFVGGDSEIEHLNFAGARPGVDDEEGRLIEHEERLLLDESRFAAVAFGPGRRGEPLLQTTSTLGRGVFGSSYCAFQRAVTRSISPPGAQMTRTFAPFGPLLCRT